MSRRSSRLVSKPPINFADLEDVPIVDLDADFSEGFLSDDEPKSKRRKKAGGPSRITSQKNKPLRGRRGKLRQLPEMPLDILYEIFGHLRPYDLLRLARTTKALRDILMCRSAVSVWKDSRAKIIGMPECPDDLSEPQYASLAFDPFCHFCGVPNIQTIMWACRLRSCQKCTNLQFVELGVARNRILCADTCNSVSASYSEPDLLIPSASSRHGKYFTRQVYLEPAITAFCQTLAAFRGDLNASQEFIDEQKAAISALQSHENLCIQWQNSVRADRYQELRDIRVKRTEAILQRIRDAGWAEELDKADEFRMLPLTEHALFEKPQELTDRIWLNIKDAMIEVMEGIKTDRLEKERIETLKQRHLVVADLFKQYSLKQPASAILPGPADVCIMPEFRSIIWDTPIDTKVDEKAFAHGIGRLPQLVEEWRSAKDAELLSILNSAASPKPNAESNGKPKDQEHEIAIDRTQLDLAVTQFQCKLGGHTISYPRILIHSCTHSLLPDWRVPSPRDPCRAMWQSLKEEPWNHDGDRVGIDQRIKPHLTKLIECCGLDPNVVTNDQMDELDARFECISCLYPASGRLAMGWRMAIAHIDIAHHAKPEWNLLDEKDTALVYEKEEQHDSRGDLLRSYRFGYGNSICCTLCRDRLSGALTAAHLKLEHGIEEPTPDHYYLHPDAAAIALTVRLPVPSEPEGEGQKGEPLEA